MKKNLWHALLTTSSFFSFLTATQAATPLWSITPLTSTTASLPANAKMSVQYTVKNNSVTHTLMMQPITGISQITTGTGNCTNPFTLPKGASCTLSLEIIGSQLTGNVTSGPVVCQQGTNEQPDPLQCYQPSNQEQSLNITKVDACTIGSECQGGTLACLGGAPYLNLIMATTNNATNTAWGSTIINVPGAQSSNDGASNTLAIINSGQTNASYAALVCANYRGGGYADWYLPAQNQTLCIASNLLLQAGTPFYWTSTQSTTNNAVSIEVGAQATVAEFLKTDPFTVRCVRNL